MTDDLTDQLRGRVHEACGGKHPCLTCQVILNAADHITELEEKLTLADILIRANTKVGADD